jgi:hypothetical protein
VMGHSGTPDCGEEGVFAHPLELYWALR